MDFSFLHTEFFIREVWRVIVVTLLMGAVIAIAELWKWKWNPPVEWTRKFSHIGCGIIVACLPWIFASRWSVIALGIIFLGAMALTRSLGLCKSIHQVERRTYGDYYYVIAVMLLFLVSELKPEFYFISILTLTIADALAALLGSTYQRYVYSVEKYRKSIEGTVVFLTSTFLIVQIPLLLMTDLEREQCILIGIQVALVVACLEAICLEGFDNLVVPLATYYMLIKLTRLPVPFLGWLIIVQAILIACVNVIMLVTPFFAFSSAIALYLFFYAAYSIGGEIWMIAPGLALLLILILHRFLHIRTKGHVPKNYQLLSVFYLTFLATTLIILNDLWFWFYPKSQLLKTETPFYLIYVGVVSGQLAISYFRLLWQHSTEPFLRKPHYSVIMILSLLSYLCVVPISLWIGKDTLMWRDLIIAAIPVFLGPSIFFYSFQQSMLPKRAPWEFRVQMFSMATAVFLTIPVYLWILNGLYQLF